MAELKEFTQVKIVKLLHSPHHYDDWKVNKRPPQVGDVGTIVDVLGSHRDNYVVEHSLWLGDFQEDELEPLE